MWTLFGGYKLVSLLVPTAISLIFLAFHPAAFEVQKPRHKAPDVIIYSGTNFTGNIKCNVFFPGCTPVCKQLIGNVKSLQSTKGTCMKFYTTADCSGAPVSYRSAFKMFESDGRGIDNLTDTPAIEWKAIGDCKQETGVPDGSVALFPKKLYQGKPCNVAVTSKCNNVCTGGGGATIQKSQSFIANVECCSLYASKNCSGDVLHYIRKGQKGYGWEDYDTAKYFKRFYRISSIGPGCL
ncbi:unnamed protein product [Bemisia tabaci]|uniref:Uncharacterized protein n=1 Tax=Bemisia tabaci TaxID=7038 RepID=A0A9P0C991_BEMTA|nr:unnamed protein product [Bemisia tabaci]